MWNQTTVFQLVDGVWLASCVTDVSPAPSLNVVSSQHGLDYVTLVSWFGTRLVPILMREMDPPPCQRRVLGRHDVT